MTIFQKASILCLFVGLVSHPLEAQNQIILDGFFEDWQGNPSVITINDAIGDSPGVDLLEMSVTNDEEHLYIKLKLDTFIDLVDGSELSNIKLYLDTDNDTSTGYPSSNILGAEYAFLFPDKKMYNNLNYPEYYSTSLYELGCVPMPTITSDEFEIMIDRATFSDTIAFFIKESVSGDVVPDQGTTFTYTMQSDYSSITPISLGKNDLTDIRVLAYNVQHNLLDAGTDVRFARIINTVNADIVTFSECSEVSESEMMNYFEEHIDHPVWYTNKMNDLLVVTKFPVLQSWSVTNKVAASLIDLPDEFYSTDFLSIYAHPPCCGNDSGRQEDFDATIAFIQDLQSAGGVGEVAFNTPFTFSGDMNLVGYAEQYLTILNGTISNTSQYGEGGFPDWDDTPISDVICRLTERTSSHTWRKNTPNLGPGEYAPGRLDFIFYSNSVLDVTKSYTLATREMSPEVLIQNGLDVDDTYLSSDHLPIVSDFALTTNSSSVSGCLYPSALNYSEIATIDDGSCIFEDNYDTGYVDGYSDGTQDCSTSCSGDFNSDEVVSTSDLLEFLTYFGQTCE
tara:strand:+ start:648 stop:2342 length:1695 start_codon:yes stop_codon:yes gene_type:complete